MKTIIGMENIAKAFHGRPILRDVSLNVGEGESLAITGANGSGKSVMLRLLCRIMEPDSGTVHIDSRFTEGKDLPVGFGVVIDRPGFIPGESGFENLRRLAKIRRRIGTEEVEAAMVRVGLDPGLRTVASKYSLGMRQKLALAQSFMEGQRVLLLDEPFNGLDEASVINVRALLQELRADGVTMVFTSHNPADIEALATRVVGLADGVIVPRALGD